MPQKLLGRPCFHAFLRFDAEQTVEGTYGIFVDPWTVTFPARSVYRGAYDIAQRIAAAIGIMTAAITLDAHKIKFTATDYLAIVDWTSGTDVRDALGFTGSGFTLSNPGDSTTGATAPASALWLERQLSAADQTYKGPPGQSGISDGNVYRGGGLACSAIDSIRLELGVRTDADFDEYDRAVAWFKAQGSAPCSFFADRRDLAADLSGVDPDRILRLRPDAYRFAPQSQAANVDKYFALPFDFEEASHG